MIIPWTSPVKPEDTPAVDRVEYKKALDESGYSEEQAKAYWKKAENTDPYAVYFKDISNTVNTQAPKVSIAKDKINIAAPQSVLDSPITGQLKKELQSLKGADLSNPDVINAIDALNKELKTNWENSLVEQTIGWTPEEYKDYMLTVQTVSGNNPMKSTTKLSGREKDGKVAQKTPQEWVDYWREIYNTDQRSDALYKSAQSKDPYDRTMALILMQGGNKPVEGFDTFERIGQGLAAFGNQMQKLPEGVFRGLATDQNTRRIEDLSQKLNLSIDSLKKNDILTQELFDAKKESLRNKTWSELSDDDKAFIITLGVSGENASIPYTERGLFRDPATIAIRQITSNDDQESRDSVNYILDNNSFEKYSEARDNYRSWNEEYDKQAEKREERQAKNAYWSGSDQFWGNLAGTIGRFYWEAALTRALTGGITGDTLKSLTNPKLLKGTNVGGVNINAISDKIGDKIVSALAARNISPASNFGKTALQFTANLIGTVPEDILQTSIDNVLTYNADENKHLLDLDQMSENFASNLVIMSLFNAAKAGVNSVKRVRMANQLAKQADLNEIIDIKGVASDVDDISRAVKNANDIKIDAEKVSIVDGDGNEKVLKNITPEQGTLIQQSLLGDIAKPSEVSGLLKTGDKIQIEVDYGGTNTWLDGEVVEEGGKKYIVGDGFEDRLDVDSPVIQRVRTIDGTPFSKIRGVELEAPKVDTSKIEVQATKANGTKMPDYSLAALNDYLRANVQPSQVELAKVRNQALASLTNDFKKSLNTFHDKFGDVTVSDFDWVNSQAKAGLKPSQIIGTTDPTTGRVVTQNMIDAMKWFSEQPFMKDLRMASRDALGFEGDFNVLGYLPHTDYNPTNMSFEEALTGVLWQKSTGASVLDDAGNYKGYGGTFEDRYKTFVSNMLWDARAKDVAAAKLLDEVRMDGQEITPELEANARKVVDGEKNIMKLVNDSSSSKDLVKNLENYTEDADEVNWKKIDDNIQKQAENSGLGQAIHDIYSDNGIYYGANSHNVARQSKAVKINLDTLGNTMKNTVVEGVGSWYDNGGADIVYAPRNAIEIVNRYVNEGGDLRDMLQEYVENHSHRSPEYASEVVDKWIAKLGEVEGPLTKGKAIYSLGNSMKWEANTRMKRWLALAKYDQFNNSTKKIIDRFLFNHMQMDSIKHNPTISQRLAKGLSDLTALRYRALFYGNIKNALLQTSELNRYFSSFKWGDVANMAKKLATDEGFRARVDGYVQAVAPMTSRLEADLYQAYSNVADSMKVGEDGVAFRDLGKKAVETADAIGLGPIEAAESFKNRMMVAGLVQEADRLGLQGDEALRHIRNRFERVALAADEMGQIGLASNPFARTMLFLQNFQIRELGMHLYNISDATGMAKTTPKKVLAAVNYITKVLGSKLATTLILARLGYSAKQTLGIDPFGLTDNYGNKLDEEDMEWVDRQISGGLLTPLFAGGMMSLISDMYFMARAAYENSTQKTISEEAEQRLEPSWGVAMPNITFDSIIGAAQNFMPGNVFVNRLNQMNEMMDTGWAKSASGNKMYSAPTNFFDTALGYLFGRSATANAQQYNQTYGDNLLQTLGRFNPYRQWGEFDPIDTKNYTDWFKGNENDLQQFEKGRRYFQRERDRIINQYQESLQNNPYASAEEKSEARNNMNYKLEELFDKIERFVSAYEFKNGSITPAMTKRIISLLNTGKENVMDSTEYSEEKQLEDYSKALSRYSALGLPAIGTYTRNKNGEVSYQGSPQWRSAVSGYYDRTTEAVNVLKEADKALAPIRKQLNDALSAAYSKKDYDTVEAIQNSYLKKFDQAVAPIIAAYGNGIIGSTDVQNQLKDMLSTGTNSRSGNLIPSDQYRKDKYGRYRSMPFETVDVKKWALRRFGSKLYTKPTIKSNSTVDEDIKEIKSLDRQGKKSRARARALELKVRVNNQVRALNNDQLKWLNNYLELTEGEV